MMVVESFVVEKGLHVRVRALCTGACHMGDRCEGTAIDHVVPTEEIEDYGFSGALQFALRRILDGYPRVIELIDH